ncbi:DUF1800 domain-containing protein [Paenibacillus sp. Soil787]|uniref:DUF1800 domain-containing protein n=1 Tax=Paenibacillus sp. Soil787 TaxID=1736411 RepID=UPI0006F5720E|nr:DUF1800 domain-containing protein [Paenibacillus sp. Soil787]KRF35857.1 hypothetical protein ASG93_25580 [Paenibacillus sp. Soil787]
MAKGWTEREIIHLLNRAAFGASELDIQSCLSFGKKETVQRLVNGLPLTDQLQRITSIEQVQADGKALKADQLIDQQIYWLYRMIQSNNPLIEKMTLFWHSHFATSFSKVQSVPLMVRQNELFRSHALGSYRDLLLAVGTDPAMMIWLDVGDNRKGSPNENYAREVMELFTLGRGHYSEQDVKEAARSFTGWRYDRDKDQPAFNPNQHDSGLKSILGVQGNMDEGDIVEVLLKQSALYDFLALKLLEAFACEDPSKTWRARIASHLTQSLQIKDALYEIFISDEFYDNNCYMTLIKSPVEYVVSLARSLSLPISRSMASAVNNMGQELYRPPDVAGWRGHESWLMTSYLLVRFQYAETVSKQVGSDWFLMDAAKPTATAAVPMDERLRTWSQRLRIGQLTDATIDGLTAFSQDSLLLTDSVKRQLLQMLLLCPESQLK